jgi:hypothetical protein
VVIKPPQTPFWIGVTEYALRDFLGVWEPDFYFLIEKLTNFSCENKKPFRK